MQTYQSPLWQDMLDTDDVCRAETFTLCVEEFRINVLVTHSTEPRVTQELECSLRQSRSRDAFARCVLLHLDG